MPCANPWRALQSDVKCDTLKVLW